MSPIRNECAAKLTAEDVRAIRASTEPLRVLQERYGVHRHTLFSIRHGLTWRHVV